MRYLEQQIRSDLKEKMVFISGPRQVGKTTLARAMAQSDGAYLNWDVDRDREKILKREWPVCKLLVLDEVHKYRPWRNLLKGLFDEHGKKLRILVTGSARLDLYRRGGDSLQGRYHLLRMHPFSPAELKLKKSTDLMQLLKVGGFPEPWFKGTENFARRWSREYRSILFREEIRSLENIHDLGNMELLAMRLPALVGSPLSLNAIREDLQVNHKTVANWLSILERLFYVFRISPIGGPKIRAVKKHQKHYHFDWTLNENPEMAFENLVACALQKWVDFKQDAEGRDYELRYFRDVDLREVDFVVTERNKPLLAIECKYADAPINKALKYLKRKYPGLECWQISATGTKDYLSEEKIRVAPALTLLSGLL